MSMFEVYLRNFMPRMPQMPTRTDLSNTSIRTDGWSTLKDEDKRKRKSKNKLSKNSRRKNRRR